MSLRQLITELRRRRVFRAAAVYIVAGWVAIQVAGMFFPAVGVPVEAIRYVWLIVASLFPLALVFAWRYEVSLDGIRLTPPTRPGDAFDPSLRKADLLLLVLLAALALSVLLQFGSRIGTGRIVLPDSVNPFSIAVLPLDDLSGDPDEQFFVSGMQSSLIDGLSRVRNLRVTAKVSTLPYRETGGSLIDIASRLGVARIVEGTVLRRDNRVSIALRMHDVENEQQVWSARYEDDLQNILMLRAKAVQEIANQVRVQLGPEEKEQFRSAQPVNAEAYLAVLRGLFHLERYNPEDMRIAGGYFRRAVEIDPDYALAHWGLAKLCAFEGQAGVVPPEETRKRCRPPILKALELDPYLPEAHQGMAGLLTWRFFDWDAARPYWERAIELNPSLAEAHMFYSHYLGIVGELDASSRHVRIAVELDPNNPFVIGLYSAQLAMVGDMRKSIEVAEQALSMAPGYAFGYAILEHGHDTLGNEREAIKAQADRLRHVAEWPEAADFVESAFLRDGYESANRQLAELMIRSSGSRHVPAMTIATLYEQAGDYDTAMDWLEKSFEQFDPNVPYIGAIVKDPGIRQHPRFRVLLEKMGLDFWAANL